jgi:hypothetical protein
MNLIVKNIFNNDFNYEKENIYTLSFLFSLSIFIILFYSGIKEKEFYFRTRNIDRRDCEENFTYFLGNFLVSLVISLFSYYFPKLFFVFLLYIFF